MCNVRVLLQVISLCFFVLQSVDSFSFVESHDGIRVRRQADNSNGKKRNCPRSSFACKSGQCIDSDKECDGAVDCEDASDESNSCHRIKCPPYLFRCNYGACINKELECDGKPDCRDASDEGKCGNKTDDASSKCKGNEFRCSSGQCIDEDFKCDGKAECDDHSDEIRETCWNVPCPAFTHKCSYGACVNGQAKCNGIVECFDGSDEDPTLCKTAPPTPTPTPPPTPVTPGPVPSGGCALPQHPEHGQWTLWQKQAEPGSYVEAGSILQIKCNRNYKLEGNNITFCDNGQWSALGKCSRVCPPRVSSETMTVTCILKNRETENCTDAVDGTLARYKCAPFYEDPSLKRHGVHICKDGTWDQPQPHCVPVCGLKTVDATTLIVNGSDVKKGDYPWQVAIYTLNDKNLICGGSLINQRTILTAAHCITNSQGSLYSKENYVVAVGKYYRDYNDSRDYSEAQFSELTNMFIPVQYKGPIQNYLGDIAILVTRRVFTLSRRVLPVCFDAGLNHPDPTSDFGYVTGWGFTKENALPSDVLKELKVPSVSISQCTKSVAEDFQVYLTHDKMCAGYLDKGTAVCRGDSGGGLVFKHDGRYFVHGIVSVSPTSPTRVDGCDSQQYAFYTKVSTYMNEFLLIKEREFRP